MVPAGCFSGLRSLRHLWLDDNSLAEVPAAALSELTALQAMTLALNHISHVPDHAFSSLGRLVVLYVQHSNTHTHATSSKVHQDNIQLVSIMLHYSYSLDWLANCYFGCLVNFSQLTIVARQSTGGLACKLALKVMSVISHSIRHIDISTVANIRISQLISSEANRKPVFLFLICNCVYVQMCACVLLLLGSCILH